MYKILISLIFWLSIALSLPPVLPAVDFTLPDTGQTKCYDNRAEIPCPFPDEPFYGQDANYEGLQLSNGIAFIAFGLDDAIKIVTGENDVLVNIFGGYCMRPTFIFRTEDESCRGLLPYIEWDEIKTLEFYQGNMGE
jgi:hypothetical protein